MPSNLVLKIGGHLISGPSGLDLSLMRSYAEIISRSFTGGRWCVVVGGGEEARRYISAARSLGLSEAFCDMLAIKVTRIHAMIFSALLGEKACRAIPESLEQLVEYSETGRIVVAGGLQPAQSTTAVAALAAEAIGAEKLIIATDVEGVYTADPKRSPHAKLLREVTLSRLEEILRESSHAAGEYKLIDQLAIKVLKRSGVTVLVIDGRKSENLEKALAGEIIGTLVTPG
ncbi:MAG: UMP kinase [Nitrososphaerota archaeon]